MKVAFIGAGGVGFTRTLLTDLLCVPEFQDMEVSFTDIDKNNLEMVTALCQRDIDSNGLKIKIKSTLNRREAFSDADYVINARAILATIFDWIDFLWLDRTENTTR